MVTNRTITDFVTKLEINDTKPPSNGVDWSTSTTSKTSATALVPSSDLNKETKNRLSITSSVHELKSISLVKNTIKNHHDHFNCNKMTAHVEQQQQQYHFNNPRNNQIAVAHKLTQNISAVNEARTVKFNKDLDEAFRDLMNVSASLKQMAERSPLGYNSFRRHSIDNVLDEKETKQPEVTRRQQLQQPKLETIENDKRNGSDNSMEKLQQKPVPAPRRKISATTSGESTKNVERKQGVETNGITGMSFTLALKQLETGTWTNINFHKKKHQTLLTFISLIWYIYQNLLLLLRLQTTIDTL